ncbi:hypothetical protein [Streptomyces griseocarneus]|uniref:hypothetical protein n=1 Tax=Streptomyces griseocarneus TaxID=51201 RepID=UPI00167D03EB|nr:hypothetical protein [Streptomyces griseocarneus]MBZ6474288.1 hypothetical protein [Streptomyces griseocarneus]GHG53104.1 hypothetical protein GCM10018779_14830 [Streptomyces griseocarneus]
MSASRRSRLLVTGAVCGALVLGVAGPTATAGPASPPPGSPGARVARPPAPEALRKAAGEGVKAIDDNVIGKQATAAVAECRAGRAPDAKRDGYCAALESHLGELGGARAGLARQAAAERPDVDAVTTATTGAVAAMARLAKARAEHDRDHDDDHGRDRDHGQDRDHGRERHDRHDDRDGPGRNGSNGLLGSVTNLVGPLVNSVGSVVGGLTSTVSGLLQSLLG